MIGYREAEICYAYLSDVNQRENDKKENYENLNREFHSSKWFGRGWTLQELLAPRCLVFFDRQWGELGTRTELWSKVSQITGIQSETEWETSSVAQKMSWAAKRETTRTEDRAYSLMGLFGVNMPPLYGEGSNAFVRLQREILRMSDDESILAWPDDEDISGGLLARSPKAFAKSGNIRRFDSIHYDKPAYAMTNKGLRMEFPLLKAWQPRLWVFDTDDTYYATLQCQFGDNKDNTKIAILVRCIKGEQYRRVSSGELIILPASEFHTMGQVERDPSIRKIIQVKQVDDSEVAFRGLYQYKFSVASNILSLKGFDVTARHHTANNERRVQWSAQQTFGEEVALVNRATGNEPLTASLELTESIEEDEDKDGNADETIKFPNRFVVIFNIWNTRARLVILVPRDGESFEDLLVRWIQPGDWLTDAQKHIPAPQLLSGVQIIADLKRNTMDAGLRSYQAEISFEEPIELPDNQVYPFQILPNLPELPNNEVTVFGVDAEKEKYYAGYVALLMEYARFIAEETPMLRGVTRDGESLKGKHTARNIMRRDDLGLREKPKHESDDDDTDLDAAMRMSVMWANNESAMKTDTRESWA